MKETLAILAGIVGLLVVVALILIVVSRPVLAMTIGAGAATVFLLLVILTAFALGMWWDRESVRQGADIALRSQESDDKRDIAMIKGLTALTTAVMRQSQQQEQLPALPLPAQQEGSWLPELADFDVVDVVDAE